MSASAIPVLLSAPIPIPLPPGRAGDWLGAAVRFDLGRTAEWPDAWPHVMTACVEEQAALDARRAALPPPEDASPAAAGVRQAFNRDQRAANRRWPAALCAYLVYGFEGGGAALPRTPQPAEVWEAYPASIVEWITTAGLRAAVAQMGDPWRADDAPAPAPAPAPKAPAGWARPDLGAWQD